MEIDVINWNNFCYWNIAPNYTEFELVLRFIFKFESKKGWTLRDIVFTIANTSVHQPGWGMLQTDLKTMLFNMDDMHRPTLKTEEDMKF
jgi:hypothetical protein